jgi:hypothetical protein
LERVQGLSAGENGRSCDRQDRVPLSARSLRFPHFPSPPRRRSLVISGDGRECRRSRRHPASRPLQASESRC